MSKLNKYIKLKGQKKTKHRLGIKPKAITIIPNSNKPRYKLYSYKERKGLAFKGFIEPDREKKLSADECIRFVSCFVINEKGEVLIEERSSKADRMHPGMKDLCSGHIDNWETPTQAMLRELHEELGINKEEAYSRLKRITENSPELFFTKNGIFACFYFFIKVKQESFKFQKDEITNITWVPMEKCFEQIRTGKTRFPKEFDYNAIFDKIRECYKLTNETDGLGIE